jgi:hypothetical protein
MRPVRTFVAMVVLASGCAHGPKKSASTPDVESAFEAAVAAEKAKDQAREAAANPPEEPATRAETAAPPFTWEQIRDATKSGRTYRYRVEVPGEPARERTIKFTNVDENGATLVSGSAKPRRLGWPTLQKDASFPKDKLTTRTESIELPAGKFDCLVYQVRGADEVWTYYFAKSLPGAPVLFYTEQDGKRTKTTTLLQHTP